MAIANFGTSSSCQFNAAQLPDEDATSIRGINQGPTLDPFQFEAGATAPGMLHVALEYIEPVIWRRVRVPEYYTLHQLHRVLQLIFSWLDYHLYSFDIGKRRFERPERESEAEEATAITLAELNLKVGQRFIYTYDFGDDWRHMIKVESFVPMPAAHEYDWSPRLMGGARAAPPEDVGGPPAYGMLLESDRGAAEMLGTLPGFDPERFDQPTLDQALALVAGWGAI